MKKRKEAVGKIGRFLLTASFRFGDRTQFGSAKIAFKKYFKKAFVKPD